jgi:hypothetical protein
MGGRGCRAIGGCTPARVRRPAAARRGRGAVDVRPGRPVCSKRVQLGRQGLLRSADALLHSWVPGRAWMPLPQVPPYFPNERLCCVPRRGSAPDGGIGGPDGRAIHARMMPGMAPDGRGRSGASHPILFLFRTIVRANVNAASSQRNDSDLADWLTNGMAPPPGRERLKPPLRLRKASQTARGFNGSGTRRRCTMAASHRARRAPTPRPPAPAPRGRGRTSSPADGLPVA